MDDQWYGQQVTTTSDPLADLGTGQAAIIRTFEFKANPEVLKREMPTKQQLFDNHAAQIKLFLWKDGLEPIDTVEPRIVLSKNKDNYRIYVGCKAKAGVIIADTPTTLQDLVKPNGSDSSNSQQNTDQLHGSVQLPTGAKT